MRLMSNQYKQAMGAIPVPQKLLEHTAGKMRRYRHSRSFLPATPVFQKKWVSISVLAACLVAVFLSLNIFHFNQPDSFILTSLRDGAVVPEVELTDGFLVFGDMPLSIALTPNLAPYGAEKQIWETERYLDYIQADPRPSALPDGFALMIQQAVVYLSAAGEVYSHELELRYQHSEHDAWISMYISSAGLSNREISGMDQNSDIRGNPLLIYYSEVENRFHAQFLKDGLGYVVSGGNLSQADFIGFIYSIFD